MKRKKIPPGLAPYFQEYSLPSLDLEEDAPLFIGRVLEHGTRKELKWLFESYGKRRIKTFVAVRGYRILSTRAFTFWRTVLKIQEFKKPPWLKDKRVVWRY